MTGHYMYAHYAGYWGMRYLQRKISTNDIAGVRAGMKMISTEVGENIKSIQARVAFTRGAARQFGLAFGIQFSPWYGFLNLEGFFRLRKYALCSDGPKLICL